MDKSRQLPTQATHAEPRRQAHKRPKPAHRSSRKVRNLREFRTFPFLRESAEAYRLGSTGPRLRLSPQAKGEARPVV